MKDQTKVIAALLIGAAAGAAIGLLLAPESGSELREDIADYVNDLVEKAKNQAQTTADDIKQYGSNVYDKAKSKFTGLVNDLSDYKDDVVGGAQSKAQGAADQAKQYGEEAYDNAKSKVKSTANEWNSSIQQS